MINLYSHQTGLPQAPRWVIKSQKGLFWNGENWSPYGENALLFNDKDEAEEVISELMQALFDAMPVWRYRTEVIIEVKGFVKPKLRSLQKLVWENITIELDVEGLITSTHIDLDTMKEIT